MEGEHRNTLDQLTDTGSGNSDVKASPYDSIFFATSIDTNYSCSPSYPNRVYPCCNPFSPVEAMSRSMKSVPSVGKTVEDKQNIVSPSTSTKISEIPQGSSEHKLPTGLLSDNTPSIDIGNTPPNFINLGGQEQDHASKIHNSQIPWKMIPIDTYESCNSEIGSKHSIYSELEVEAPFRPSILGKHSNNHKHDSSTQKNIHARLSSSDKHSSGPSVVKVLQKPNQNTSQFSLSASKRNFVHEKPESSSTLLVSRQQNTMHAHSDSTSKNNLDKRQNCVDSSHSTKKFCGNAATLFSASQASMSQLPSIFSRPSLSSIPPTTTPTPPTSTPPTKTSLKPTTPITLATSTVTPTITRPTLPPTTPHPPKPTLTTLTPTTPTTSSIPPPLTTPTPKPTPHVSTTQLRPFPTIATSTAPKAWGPQPPLRQYFNQRTQPPPSQARHEDYWVQQPRNSYLQPPNPHLQPPNPHLQPPNPYFQPPNSYFQPPNSYFQPPNQYLQPPNSYFQPPNSHFQPPNPYFQPPNQYLQPSNPHLNSECNFNNDQRSFNRFNAHGGFYSRSQNLDYVNNRNNRTIYTQHIRPKQTDQAKSNKLGVDSNTSVNTQKNIVKEKTIKNTTVGVTQPDTPQIASKNVVSSKIPETSLNQPNQKSGTNNDSSNPAQHNIFSLKLHSDNKNSPKTSDSDSVIGHPIIQNKSTKSDAWINPGDSTSTSRCSDELVISSSLEAIGCSQSITEDLHSSLKSPFPLISPPGISVPNSVFPQSRSMLPPPSPLQQTEVNSGNLQATKGREVPTKVEDRSPKKDQVAKSIENSIEKLSHSEAEVFKKSNEIRAEPQIEDLNLQAQVCMENLKTGTLPLEGSNSAKVDEDLEKRLKQHKKEHPSELKLGINIKKTLATSVTEGQHSPVVKTQKPSHEGNHTEPEAWKNTSEITETSAETFPYPRGQICEKTSEGVDNSLKKCSSLELDTHKSIDLNLGASDQITELKDLSAEGENCNSESHACKKISEILGEIPNDSSCSKSFICENTNNEKNTGECTMEDASSELQLNENIKTSQRHVKEDSLSCSQVYVKTKVTRKNISKEYSHTEPPQVGENIKKKTYGLTKEGSSLILNLGNIEGQSLDKVSPRTEVSKSREILLYESSIEGPHSKTRICENKQGKRNLSPKESSLTETKVVKKKRGRPPKMCPSSEPQALNATKKFIDSSFKGSNLENETQKHSKKRIHRSPKEGFSLESHEQGSAKKIKSRFLKRYHDSKLSGNEIGNERSGLRKITSEYNSKEYSHMETPQVGRNIKKTPGGSTKEGSGIFLNLRKIMDKIRKSPSETELSEDRENTLFEPSMEGPRSKTRINENKKGKRDVSPKKSLLTETKVIKRRRGKSPKMGPCSEPQGKINENSSMGCSNVENKIQKHSRKRIRRSPKEGASLESHKGDSSKKIKSCFSKSLHNSELSGIQTGNKKSNTSLKFNSKKSKSKSKVKVSKQEKYWSYLLKSSANIIPLLSIDNLRSRVSKKPSGTNANVFQEVDSQDTSLDVEEEEIGGANNIEESSSEGNAETEEVLKDAENIEYDNVRRNEDMEEDTGTMVTPEFDNLERSELASNKNSSSSLESDIPTESSSPVNIDENNITSEGQPFHVPDSSGNEVPNIVINNGPLVDTLSTDCNLAFISSSPTVPYLNTAAHSDQQGNLSDDANQADSTDPYFVLKCPSCDCVVKCTYHDLYAHLETCKDVTKQFSGFFCNMCKMYFDTILKGCFHVIKNHVSDIHEMQALKDQLGQSYLERKMEITKVFKESSADMLKRIKENEIQIAPPFFQLKFPV